MMLGSTTTIAAASSTLHHAMQGSGAKCVGCLPIGFASSWLLRPAARHHAAAAALGSIATASSLASPSPSASAATSSANNLKMDADSKAAASANRAHSTLQPAQTAATKLADWSLLGDGQQDLDIVSPIVIQKRLPNHKDVSLYVGIHAPSDTDLSRPGNGGLRLWSYDTEEEAIDECRELSRGMALKHRIYNTGFSGAKLVANAKEPGAVDKRQLMEEVAEALHSLDGSVYTGCDMNTDFKDMKYLSELCPYVLASLESTIDANKSTAHGVVGAVAKAAGLIGARATSAHDEEKGGRNAVKGKTFLVLGTGKVGSHVSEILASLGGRVLTHDAIASRADVPGCTNVSDVAQGRWWEVAHDILVPCCASGVITAEAVPKMTTKVIVGATNIPFESTAAHRASEERGIVFIPDMLSSAGAVLADSIEHYSASEYQSARDSEVYAFVQTLISDKTEELLEVMRPPGGQIANPSGASAAAGDSLKLLSKVFEDKGTQPVGRRFSTWRESPEHTYDIAIIGGGMAGTAASYYLSKLAPEKTVAVIEKGNVADSKASSYGQSRMYRKMYSDEYFSLMQSKALELWGDLERESGQKLMKENGLLFYGEVDTGETVEGSIPGAAEVMQKLGIPHQYFSADEMNSKWPMRALSGYEGVYEETAGSINSSMACDVMMGLAQSKGHSLYTNTSVLDVGIPLPGKVHITCSDGNIIKAKQVILAAGAWTNELLKHLDSELDLEIWLMHWGHYRVQKELKERYPQWFCFRKEVPQKWDGGLYYGFPIESEEPIIKVGIDFCPEDPRFRMRSMSQFNYAPNDTIVELMDDFVANNWDGIGERVDMFASPYTVTRDQYFVLDRLAKHPEVTLFTGGCGRAFKFGPLLGKLLAEKTLDMPLSYDIEPFSAMRECVQWGG